MTGGIARPRVFVSRRVFPEVLDYLGQHLEVAVNPGEEPLGPDALATAIGDREGLLLSGFDPFRADLIARCPRLKAVCNIAVGFNNIDVAACTAAGIRVTNTPEVVDDGTADLAWALILGAGRQVVAWDRWLRAGHWQDTARNPLRGRDIHHATLGILGLGRVGRAIAARAAGFSMQVVYHNRRRLEPGDEAAIGARWLPKDELLRAADFLVLALPYTPENRHAVGAAELALMKPTACLINVARGGIVDDGALIAALREKRLAGAGLDVFENEPAFDPGFLELDNVVLTPHIGTATRATRVAMAMRAAGNLVTAMQGRRPRDVVNPEVESMLRA